MVRNRERGAGMPAGANEVGTQRQKIGEASLPRMSKPVPSAPNVTQRGSGTGLIGQPYTLILPLEPN